MIDDLFFYSMKDETIVSEEEINSMFENNNIDFNNLPFKVEDILKNLEN